MKGEGRLRRNEAKVLDTDPDWLGEVPDPASGKTFQVKSWDRRTCTELEFFEEGKKIGGGKLEPGAGAAAWN